jgi:hypothetical protein
MTTRTPRLLALLLVAAGCGGEPGSLSTSGRSEATLVAAPTVEVVMSNLNSPRGLAWGPEGGLYVVEAGLDSATSLCAPVARGQNCYSGSGSISRLVRGHQERVVTALPSVFNAATSDITGPHDIAFGRNGRAFLSIGWGGDPAARASLGELGRDFGTLIALRRTGGEGRDDRQDSDEGENDDQEDARPAWRIIADVSAFEAAHNPAGGTVDSNPYGLLMEGRRLFFVTDAGGNSLLSVQRGVVSLVTTFPAIPVPPGPFNPPFTQSQAVPTEVARGPDGALYVSTLTGVPFRPGVASIFRVTPGESPTIYAAGFTQVTDFSFGHDGALYVLQYASGPFFSGNGSVIRVAPDGTRTTLTTALFHPTGIAVGKDGRVYVSNNGNLARVGEVVRITP